MIRVSFVFFLTNTVKDWLAVLTDQFIRNHGGRSGVIVAARNGKGIVGMAFGAKLRFSAGFAKGPYDDADVINLYVQSQI